ncbi:MAG: DUF4118 domain-containing protein, partial [Candidatus Eisenbacteria bacterium]
GWAAAGTLGAVGACTAIAALIQRHFDLSNLTMVYLLGVVIVGIAFGRGAAIAAAILSVAVFDFVFVPPRYTFRVADTQYLVTFVVMLVVAIVIGTLTARLREQFEGARMRERRTAALYHLSHDLAVRSTAADVLEAAVDRIAHVLEARVAAYVPQGSNNLRLAAGDGGLIADEAERTAARNAYDDGRTTGFEAQLGSGTQREGQAGLHIPLQAGANVLGVLSLLPMDPAAFREPARQRLLRALVDQTALALERCRLGEEAHQARMQVETERARNALLSSVSHDLRTPLAAITGAASNLRDDQGTLSEPTRRELADTISEEAQRLNRLIGNLLDMTRLESGTLRVKKEWVSLEEVVGAALARLGAQLDGRPVRLALPEDRPLVPLDDVLFEQVVFNLVENANKYSPPGEPVEVSAEIQEQTLRFAVADRGTGFGPGEELRVFEKFYRGLGTAGQPGAGLGLAISKGIVEAHSGRIEAENRPLGGATFTVWLPIEGEAPRIDEEPFEATPGMSAG